MNTTLSIRTLSVLAALGLAAASLTACMPTSVADGCKQLDAEMGPLTEKAKTLFTDPATAADGIDQMVADMKAISGKVTNPEVKQAWDEMVASFEGVKPAIQKVKELSSDPSKALENVEEFRKISEEMKPHSEKMKAAGEKLQKLCPNMTNITSTQSN